MNTVLYVTSYLAMALNVLKYFLMQRLVRLIYFMHHLVLKWTTYCNNITIIEIQINITP